MVNLIPSSPAMDRRRLLASALVGVGAGALPVERAIAATVPSETVQPMTARAEEGPYYLPLDLRRADITEGLPGVPMDLRFTVLDRDGRPYAGALVDVWHCNAQGVYSGFGGQQGHGETGMKDGSFLRGVQAADDTGNILFHSIYPGWYSGRTTHIHFKIRHGSVTNLTSQFFLPDTLSEYLYTQVPAYRRAAMRDTLNSTDGIAIEAGDTVEGNVRETRGGRYLASLLVRVDRLAVASPERFGGPGGPGGPPPPGPPPGGPPPFGPDGREGPPHPVILQGEARVAALLPDAKRMDRPRGPGGPPPI